MAISINGADCIACGACISACPLDLIVLGDVAAIEDTDSCIECGSCVDACPLGLIEL